MIGIGLIGGFINSLLDGSLRFPKTFELPENRGRALDLDCIGNVLIGGAAAAVFWGFGLSNPDQPQVFITALLSGIGGSRILKDQLDKRVLNILNESLAREVWDAQSLYAYHYVRSIC